MALHVVERKFDIEMKLKKELGNVAAVRAGVARSTALSSDVCGVLGACERRLQKLESAVLPLYGDTARLQRLHRNMERTSQALDHVINFYLISQELADLIGAGPITTSPDTLNIYLEALDKLAEAQTYFNKNNPQSVELENINTLYNSGVSKLESSFEELLNRHTRPLSPTMLLDMIALEEDSSVESASVSGSGSTVSVGVEAMRAAAAWLSGAGRAPVAALIAVRAPNAKNSLQGFRDYLKTRSMGHSPLMRAKNIINRSDSSAKKTSRIHKALEKKANKMLLKASQTLEQSTGLALGPRRALNESYTGDTSNSDIAGLEESEVEPAAELAACLCRIARAEQRALLGLVPLPRLPALLQAVLADCWPQLASDVERVCGRYRRAAAKCSSGAANTWTLLARLQRLQPDIERALAPAPSTPYTAIVANCQTNCVRCLDEWVDGVRNDAGAPPVDGTVHQLAAAALAFLQNLAEHVQTLGPALMMEPWYARALAQLPHAHDRSAALLAVYMRKVLAQLNLTLRTKSDQYPDALKAIFRLNNTHYLLQGLQRSCLLDVLLLAEPDCETSYQDMVQEARNAYLQSWSKLLAHTVLEETPPAKLRDRDRQIIKDKFSAFNRELEDCTKAQRSYSVPDAELRESLKRDNKERVLPAYTRFHDTCSRLSFSKNIDKYVKYDPLQMLQQMSQKFWSHWFLDYLHFLQQHLKWTDKTNAPKAGDLRCYNKLLQLNWTAISMLQLEFQVLLRETYVLINKCNVNIEEHRH